MDHAWSAYCRDRQRSRRRRARRRTECRRRAAKREVRIGARRPGRLEIAAGLDVGERTAVAGTVEVRDSAPVRDLASEPARASYEPFAGRPGSGGGEAALMVQQLEVTDYAERYLVGRFAAVPGMALVQAGGGRRNAMRIRLDREARESKLAGGKLWLGFGFALLIVYPVLAAQFDSLLHPLISLATVPLAIGGALIGRWLFGASINVCSQIGPSMLIEKVAQRVVGTQRPAAPEMGRNRT